MMAVGSRQYGYSYSQSQDCVSEHSDTCGNSHNGVIINVRCPTLSSARWCYKLYSIVLAGLGLILSFLWVCFHLYALSQTTTAELRLQRYLDIFLGLVEFISMLCLLYASYSYSRLFIIVFMTSSLGVVVIYWGWYSYYTYDTDTLVYDDQTGTGLVVTMVFLVLLLPVCLHYRSIELQQDVDTENDRQEDVKIHRHRHERHRHRDRSPPPKYHESFPSASVPAPDGCQC